MHVRDHFQECHTLSQYTSMNVPTPYLAVLDGLPEEVVQEEAGQFGVLVKGGLDVTEEAAADDASSTPHEGDGAVVQLPAVALGRFS